MPRRRGARRQPASGGGITREHALAVAGQSGQSIIEDRKAYAGWAGSLPAEVVRERLDRVLRESELPSNQWLPAYMTGMFYETAPQKLLDHALSISTVHPLGLRIGITSFAEADLRDVLPRIDVPTLLPWGDGDQGSFVSIADEMHDRIPHSTLVLLPGVGHVSNLEAPAAFNDALRAFFHEH